MPLMVAGIYSALQQMAKLKRITPTDIPQHIPYCYTFVAVVFLAFFCSFCGILWHFVAFLKPNIFPTA